MKRMLSLILAAVMVMALVACGGTTSTDSTDSAKTDTSTEGKAAESIKVEATDDAEAEYAKEITLALGLGELDPGGWSSSRESYLRFVFDTLLYHDDMTGEITMQLAKSVEWDNDECTRIHVILRDDVVFSNGDPVTAADCQFSFDRSTYSTMTTYYDSCDIVSDTEFYINLKTPCSVFIPCLTRSFAAIACKAEAEKNPDGLALIGSGPYVYDMDTHVAANSITLSRNDKFWGEVNPTEKIHIVKIADASAAAIALQNGEIDLALSLNETELPGLRANENLEVVEHASYNFIYLSFNDHADSASLTEEEKNFRRACACAVNKEDIVAGVGGGMVMTSMWPFDRDGYIANESDYEHDLSYNPEQAKEYLAKAGGKTEFTCLVDTSKSWTKIAAQIVQEYLRQVGITMNIVETDNTGFVAMTKWNTLEYDASMWYNLFVTEPGDWNYFNTGSNVNRAAMVDPEIVEAMKVIAATDDEAEKAKLYDVVQREIHDSVSWLPLIWRNKNYVYTKGLENFEFTSAPTYVLRNIRLRTN